MDFHLCLSGLLILYDAGLRARLPGFCHISCGDLARLATAYVGSPFLSSIARQLADRRRRKAAFSRLTDVLHKVIAEGLRSTDAVGTIIDGLRVSELPAFEQVTGCDLIALISLSCPPSEMLSRLSQRECRDGDERLGLAEMGHDHASRVKAFQEREVVEIEQLKGREAFLPLDTGAGSVEELADKVLGFAAPLMQIARGAAPNREGVPTTVDWTAQLAATAEDLDRQFYPDGKPRSSMKRASACV